MKQQAKHPIYMGWYLYEGCNQTGNIYQYNECNQIWEDIRRQLSNICENMSMATDYKWIMILSTQVNTLIELYGIFGGKHQQNHLI